MRKFIKFFLLMAVLVFQFSNSPEALAQKESCEQCKFLDCLKSAIKQKEAMRVAYLELAKKWEKFWVKTDSGSQTPLDEINLQKLYPMSRIVTMSILNAEFTQLRKDEEDLATRIGPPPGCGYSPSEGLEIETDSIKCSIDMLKARKAEEASPCKELYEIAFRHEALHMQKCQQRKGNKALPTVMLTPAGKAREEAVAYAQEIAELKKILKELEKKCSRTATATTPNGITYKAVRCEASPWGTWKLSITGGMAGQGTVSVHEDGSGNWSANTVVPGVGVGIKQTGTAKYVEEPSPQLRLTTSFAAAGGKSAAPMKSIDLQVSYGSGNCPNF